MKKPYIEEQEFCDHPNVEVTQLAPLDDGTPVLQGRCLTCGFEEIEPMAVKYAPGPFHVANVWLPVTVLRGDLAICANCGAPIFSILHPVPMTIFLEGNSDVVFGQIDLCRRCSVGLLSKINNVEVKR